MSCMYIYCIAGNFRHLFSSANFLSVIFLSCVSDNIEDMATFTTLVKICFTESFCNTKVVGLSETFVQRKYLAIWYMIVLFEGLVQSCDTATLCSSPGGKNVPGDFG